MGIKDLSTASSNSSGKMVQSLVNYRLKENASEFMTADELLTTQYITEKEKDNPNELGLQVKQIKHLLNT